MQSRIPETAERDFEGNGVQSTTQFQSTALLYYANKCCTCSTRRLDPSNRTYLSNVYRHWYRSLETIFGLPMVQLNPCSIEICETQVINSLCPVLDVHLLLMSFKTEGWCIRGRLEPSLPLTSRLTSAMLPFSNCKQCLYKASYSTLGQETSNCRAVYMLCDKR